MSEQQKKDLIIKLYADRGIDGREITEDEFAVMEEYAKKAIAGALALLEKQTETLKQRKKANVEK